MENFPGLQFGADAVAGSAGTADGMLCFGNGEQFLHPLPWKAVKGMLPEKQKKMMSHHTK